MNTNPFLGVFLHAIGGLAAGSFYIPYKGVRRWSWESYWLAGGVFSWLIAPWVLAACTCPNVFTVLGKAPASAIGLSYLFGMLWGVGGLTFGLTMRYLGMSLGMALALGFCATFGTVMPPLVGGELLGLISSVSGLVTLGGVVVCVAGIAICGRAGMFKEKELSAEQKTASIKEFNFMKGVWVAVFSGILSSCMAYGIKAGKPIADLALAHGTEQLWQNTPVFVVILLGGFTTNFIWCVGLNVRNGSARDYVTFDSTLLPNYIFCALAGVTWYLQFMFYGMGTTQMGAYDFSSWTIHMAFIIIFSTTWGLILREWRGSSKRTQSMVFAGIAVLVLSTMVVGLGNYLAK